MPLPKPRNRYRVSEMRRQMAEKLGLDPDDPRPVTLETDSGHVLKLPHPLFYTRDQKADIAGLDDDDFDGILRALVGDEEVEAFIAAGGDPEDVPFVWLAVTRDAQDVMAGKARPTRS